MKNTLNFTWVVGIGCGIVDAVEYFVPVRSLNSEGVSTIQDAKQVAFQVK